MDLCNGGMIWSCCVDRDKVDFVDPELGAVKDAQCGEVHTTGGQARIVGGHDSKERILSSYYQTQKLKTDCSSVKPELVQSKSRLQILQLKISLLSASPFFSP